MTKKHSKDNATEKDALKKLTIHVAHPDKAKSAFQPLKAIANGVFLARDLVNEPANMLGPVEFADRVKELEQVGVKVEILDVDALSARKMGCLLAVGQGSVRPSRVCVMQWHGAKSKRPSRSASSARASSSIRAASRSNPRAAWRT